MAQRILDLGPLTKPMVIFGGLFGNIDALLMFIATMGHQKFEASQIVSTGNLVGIGASPEECLELVRYFGYHAIQGNMEQQLCAYGHFNKPEEASQAKDPAFQQCFEYTRKTLTDTSLNWMADLPEQITFNLAGFQVLVTHGGVRSITTQHYPSAEAKDLRKEFSAAKNCECIIAGNTGHPMLRQPLGEDAIGLWHNTGYLGLPANDGTPRGWYTILTPLEDGLQCDLVPLNYDHDAAAEKIHAAGLPPIYAEMLQSGLNPQPASLPLAERAISGVALDSSTFVLKRNSEKEGTKSPAVQQ